jgi:hypothetical protein
VGTWGKGNLDGDGPCDFLDSVVDNLEQEIESCFEGELNLQTGEDVLMPALHIWSRLCDSCEAHAPQVDQLKKWKASYLPVYDREMPELADPEFTAERRKVIEATFTRLEQQSEMYWSKVSQLDNGTCSN